VAEPSSTSIVIPAFNEEPAIGPLVTALRTGGAWHEIIVIDDGSSDATSERAREAGATVVRHPYNKGNGAAVKTGIRHATGEYVLIVDGDGQHRAGDLTSGFRGARRSHLREFLHLLPNGFSTPTTTTLAFIKAGYNVCFEPVEAGTRVGSSKIRLARDGVRFLLIAMKIVTLFSPFRVFLPISFLSFLGGAGYAAWTVATQSHVTNSSVLLIMLAVIVFLVGLVSEQIAALRFEGRE
jgi:glycosyltransferase involved in cell wall biosynthesis